MNNYKLKKMLAEGVNCTKYVEKYKMEMTLL